MSKRKRTFLVVSALFVSLTSLASAQDPSFRSATAREDATIFSPLDLPTPNSVRNGAGAPGPDYWQQRVDYRIEASFDPESRVVSATEHVTYHNMSPDALEYLWLNVEQNAFKQESIAARVGLTTAIGMRDAEGEGTRIASLTSGGKDLQVHVYDTLARVELPAPIPPKTGTFEFDLAWQFAIPEKVFRRFGILECEQGNVYEVAQWFPNVAVYDDVYGWNTLPYIGTGEFYTNFGTIDVELTVPRDMILVATGVLQNPGDVFTAEQNGRLAEARKSEETIPIRSAEEVSDPASRPAGEGPLTWKFHAENVRTFAWACSKAFILDAAGQDGILFQSAYPKEALAAWGESTKMLRSAVVGYNQRWYRYPYPVATNVYGAEGGMEYPMIIFCRGRSERGVFGVTAHEIGHNWFPMMVNSDERRHAWMDEGFNSFINIYAGQDYYGTEPEGGRGRRRGGPGGFGRSMLQPDLLPIDTKPDMLPGRLLGQLEYAKTAVGLQLLRETILGPERFDYAFRKYIERWAFKSPQPADFFRTMEDAAGADLAWFWRGWFLETGYLDQAVAEVTQPTEDKDGEIVFENLGRLVMPLSYRVEREDGSSADYDLPVELWFHSNGIEDRIPGKSPIVAVTIDPDESYPDVNRDNNAWPVVEKAEAAEGEPGEASAGRRGSREGGR